MKYPKIRLVHNRRCTATASHPATVELEMSFNGQQRRYSTGVAVALNQWSPSAHVVRHPDAPDLNLRIDAFEKSVKSYVNKLIVDNMPFSFDDLARFLRGEKYDNILLVDYISKKIDERNDLRPITKRNHREIIGVLEKFGRFATLQAVSPKQIKAFDNWLKGQGYIQSTVASYHKVLKTYINIAVAEEIIPKSPYAGMKIDKGKSRVRKFLSDEELRAVRDLQTDDPSTMRARDLFLFQCFTGLAYVDLERFDFSKVEERGGKYVMRDERKKTGTDFYIVLLSPAVEILKKYDFKLPVISNQKYNYALKAVAAGAGIRFSLTSHMGRHTFATYCLNRGIPIETLATMMGHSDVRSTQIYAKIVNKTVENAFGMLEASLTD